MSHYKSNLRDIEFNLFEVLRRQDVLGKPPYEELDTDTCLLYTSPSPRDS